MTVLVNGCTNVAFYQKGRLSDPIMALSDNPMSVNLTQKVYYSREGSVGGIGGVGWRRMRLLLKRQRLRIGLILLFTSLGFASMAYAENGRKIIEEDDASTSGSGKGGGTGFVGFSIGAYHNGDDGDGNPFLDEKLTVIESILIFDYNVSDTTSYWGKTSYDYISSASIERLSNFPAHSGASGDYYFGLDLGIKNKLSETSRAGGFVSTSSEFDYNSIGIGGDYARDSDDKNTTIKLTMNGFWDRIDIVRFDATNGLKKENRVSMSSSLSWYQVISPKTHGEIGCTFSYQTGFLETPYNAVVIEDPNFSPNPQLDNFARGEEQAETLPGKRIRGTVLGRIRKKGRGQHCR